MIGRYAVYLLCFPDAPPSERHYVGITTPDRLSARMIEHRSARGSKRTALACERDETWHHTLTLLTCCRSTEKALATAPALDRLCPRCREGLTFPALRAYPKGKKLSYVGGIPDFTRP